MPFKVEIKIDSVLHTTHNCGTEADALECAADARNMGVEIMLKGWVKDPELDKWTVVDHMGQTVELEVVEE